MSASGRGAYEGLRLLIDRFMCIWLSVRNTDVLCRFGPLVLFMMAKYMQQAYHSHIFTGTGTIVNIGTMIAAEWTGEIVTIGAGCRQKHDGLAMKPRCRKKMNLQPRFL